MRGVGYMVGRALQLVGMLYVGIAFLSFFGKPDMGRMMKDTGMGLLEFYIGYFLVSRTGEKEGKTGEVEK